MNIEFDSGEEKMNIRKARGEDLDVLDLLYQNASQFMAQQGNPTQWPKNYIKKEFLKEDIEEGILYVVEEEGSICGAFVFIEGEEPTYQKIEGKWLSNEPYGTIHRLASNQEVHGLFAFVLEYCRNRINHIRIDTHKDNQIMQHLILKNGFTYCGIIYVEDGTPRYAYEL